jgi:hypothetical protein
MSLLGRALRTPISPSRWLWTWGLPATLGLPLLAGILLGRREPPLVAAIQAGSLGLCALGTLGLGVGIIEALARLYACPGLRGTPGRQAALMLCVPLWLGQLWQRLPLLSEGSQIPAGPPLPFVLGNQSIGAGLAAAGILLLYKGLGELDPPVLGSQRDRLILSASALFAGGSVGALAVLPRLWKWLFQSFYLVV